MQISWKRALTLLTITTLPVATTVGCDDDTNDDGGAGLGGNDGDGFNPRATTPEEYVLGTPDFRTDLYSTCGTLVTHAESIELIEGLGSKFTPELKEASVTMPFEGFSQEDYAQKLIDEYKDAGIPASDVWPHVRGRSRAAAVGTSRASPTRSSWTVTTSSYSTY